MLRICTTNLRILIFFLSINSYGQSGESKIRKKIKLSFGVEYQKENFQWSIAGTPKGTNPNILSELIFNPIKASGFHIDGSFRIIENLAISMGYKQLFTFQGFAEDNDYSGDNRTIPLNLQTFESDKGKTRQLNANILYTGLNKPNFKGKVRIGYNYTTELFYLLSSDLRTLNSTYQPVWNGPFLTLSPEWNINKKLFAALGANFLLLNYYAEANWNEIKTFQHPKSFTHDANGFGLDYKLETTYKVNETLSLTIEGFHSKWWTNHGVDKLYLLTGDILETRFNNAKKKNVGLRLSGILLF